MTLVIVARLIPKTNLVGLQTDLLVGEKGNHIEDLRRFAQRN